MPDTADPLRTAQPETAAALARTRFVAWESTDPELLTLCRDRVATLFGEAPRVDDPERDLSDKERAFLAFTDQFVLSVASVSDADVDALLAHMDPVDVYQFVAALYAIEMSMRIELAGRSVLGRTEVAA